MKTMPMILKQIPNIQIPCLPPLNLGQQEALPAPLILGPQGVTADAYGNGFCSDLKPKRIPC